MWLSSPLANSMVLLDHLRALQWIIQAHSSPLKAGEGLKVHPQDRLHQGVHCVFGPGLQMFSQINQMVWSIAEVIHKRIGSLLKAWFKMTLFKR